MKFEVLQKLSHCQCTVDWEIVTLKIIHMKIYCGVKFLQFSSIHEIFLTVDDYIWTSAWRVPSVYQVSGEPGIAGCSC